MKPTRLPAPQRLRRLPKPFSWIDPRLVREGYLQRCDTVALALYLFLLTVADAQGISFYSDKRLCRELHLDAARLKLARDTLRQVGLIAYEAPFYQVLDLAPQPCAPKAAASSVAALRQCLQAKEKRHGGL